MTQQHAGDQLIKLFETWFRADLDRSELTVNAYVVDVRNFINWWQSTNGANFDLERVIPTNLKDYRSYLSTAREQKVSSVNRRLAALRTFFKWAVLSGRIGRSPLNGVRTLRQQDAAPRWLDPQAEDSLQQALERRLQLVSAETAATPADQRAVRDVAMILLMWKAGLRVSEVAALDVSDVKIQSSKRGTVQIRRGKGRKQRTVPLNATVIEGLRRWLAVRPQAGKALFLSRSDIRLTSRAIQQIVEQIGREAAAMGRTRSQADREIAESLSALSPHVLRHTCGKRLLDAGAQLTEVAQILGHEDLNITRRYTQPSADDLQRAADRI